MLRKCIGVWSLIPALHSNLAHDNLSCALAHASRSHVTTLCRCEPLNYSATARFYTTGIVDIACASTANPILGANTLVTSRALVLVLKFFPTQHSKGLNFLSSVSIPQNIELPRPIPCRCVSRAPATRSSTPSPLETVQVRRSSLA
ncbi:hypothetical protein F5Y18DRAFT_111055 [Xylariaceae sp. FL1019]|nr:hypothetical protein F5Y18DRAFT_111055 [Xylariaceae sp. FL1019]